MGLAMSNFSKNCDQTRKCTLFEREKVDLYENYLASSSQPSPNTRSEPVDKQATDYKIEVLDISAFVEDKLTIVEERKDVLRYVTPQFR